MPLKARPGVYDPEIEKERLAFEQRKWEAEQEQRKIELEERKRKEEIEMEERKCREEFETEERKRREEIEQQMWEAEQEQRRIELELRTRELQRQEARDKIEDQRKASAVVKGKLFGDAMRASAIRMGADHIEAIHRIFPQRRTVVFCL